MKPWGAPASDWGCDEGWHASSDPRPHRNPCTHARPPSTSSTAAMAPQTISRDRVSRLFSPHLSLSLPYLSQSLPQLPLLDTVLTHARRTGYDEFGHTVPFQRSPSSQLPPSSSNDAALMAPQQQAECGTEGASRADESYRRGDVALDWSSRRSPYALWQRAVSPRMRLRPRRCSYSYALANDDGGTATTSTSPSCSRIHSMELVGGATPMTRAARPKRD